MTYKEIAAEYNQRFGNGSRTKVGSIRVYVNNIKRLEQVSGRRYLRSSGGKPEKYKIHKEFVEYQRSAIVLLEADKGYKQLANDRPLELEIARDDFEQYLFDTYGWDRVFITRRVKDATASHYIGLPEFEAGRQFVVVEDRLNDDLEYLRLVVDNYYLEQRHENSTSKLVSHLVDLLTLYAAQ